MTTGVWRWGPLWGCGLIAEALLFDPASAGRGVFMGIIHLILLAHKMWSQISAAWALVRHADPPTQAPSSTGLSAFPGVGTEQGSGCRRRHPKADRAPIAAGKADSTATSRKQGSCARSHCEHPSRPKGLSLPAVRSPLPCRPVSALQCPALGPALHTHKDWVSSP